MKDSLKERLDYFSKRLEQLEELSDDNPIKRKWKSGEVSDTLAIYYLELGEYLEDETP